MPAINFSYSELNRLKALNRAGTQVAMRFWVQKFGILLHLCTKNIFHLYSGLRLSLFCIFVKSNIFFS